MPHRVVVNIYVLKIYFEKTHKFIYLRVYKYDLSVESNNRIQGRKMRHTGGRKSESQAIADFGHAQRTTNPVSLRARPDRLKFVARNKYCGADTRLLREALIQEMRCGTFQPSACAVWRMFIR